MNRFQVLEGDQEPLMPHC